MGADKSGLEGAMRLKFPVNLEKWNKIIFTKMNL